MDLEEKEEKNTQSWLTIPPPKKRENKSDSQPAEKSVQGPLKNHPHQHQHHHPSSQNTQ
ncbi:hypothetical protein K0M31_001145 [Melipona bicolor]|uniref:Uncharacterized protein n=1 Tax=Melipona bicolor TaxID=60889 RepID=A0AA40GFV8_9HYME|nr:hypothetical protein K0M31_001145 [Melipona bicolor]